MSFVLLLSYCFFIGFLNYILIPAHTIALNGMLPNMDITFMHGIIQSSTMSGTLAFLYYFYFIFFISGFKNILIPAHTIALDSMVPQVFRLANDVNT
jgi:hypothetical protein